MKQTQLVRGASKFPSPTLSDFVGRGGAVTSKVLSHDVTGMLDFNAEAQRSDCRHAAAPPVRRTSEMRHTAAQLRLIRSSRNHRLVAVAVAHVKDDAQLICNFCEIDNDE